jgi:hypothetical protein
VDTFYQLIALQLATEIETARHRQQHPHTKLNPHNGQ